MKQPNLGIAILRAMLRADPTIHRVCSLQVDVRQYLQPEFDDCASFGWRKRQKMEVGEVAP